MTIGMGNLANKQQQSRGENYLKKLKKQKETDGSGFTLGQKQKLDRWF